MTDVARALMLPDLQRPNIRVVRNLSIYWDEIVCPAYRGQEILPTEDPLVLEGIAREVIRDIPDEHIYRAGLGDGENLEGKLAAFRVHQDENGRLTRVELRTEKEPDSGRRRFKLGTLSEAQLEALAAISLVEHMGRVEDSLAIAADNNLAPVSHSVGGHLATVVDSSKSGPADAPMREAALMSVIVEAFAIHPDTSSDVVLQFRERSKNARAKFRASLVDLGSQLREDGSPTAMLAEARDTCRNRVEPALGNLEEVLKENGVSFFLKSLMGATAIATAPIEPVSTSVGAAKVIGQAIDYPFSKSRLVREHPYGYLHEVTKELPSTVLEPSNDLTSTMMSPRDSLWRLWLDDWRQSDEFERSKAGS